MGKNPAFQFYTGDWKKDPRLAMCSLAARGVWVELLCAMHDADRSGVVTGTTEQLARLCRCSAVDFARTLDELTSTRTADVSERDGVYTIVSRRMLREAQAREAERDKKKKQRGKRACPDDVPRDVPQMSPPLSSVSVSSSETSPPPPSPVPGQEPPESAEEEGDDFPEMEGVVQAMAIEIFGKLGGTLRNCGFPMPEGFAAESRSLARETNLPLPAAMLRLADACQYAASAEGIHSPDRLARSKARQGLGADWNGRTRRELFPKSRESNALRNWEGVCPSCGQIAADQAAMLPEMICPRPGCGKPMRVTAL